MQSAQAFEERYTLARDQLFVGLSRNADPASILQDITTHGSVLWALMKKTGTGVAGEHFKVEVYLQYYYHYLAKVAQRPAVKRPLDVTNLAFLTCVAAFGYRRGCAEFDAVLKNNNVAAIDKLVIGRDSFMTFFWGDSLDVFSFLCCWRIINNLWELWDNVDPIKILGFTSDTLSFHLLGHQIKTHGAFLFRFSSQGGLSVDYIGKSSPNQLPGTDGQFVKVLWKENAIPDIKTFMQELFQGQLSGSLHFLLDAANPQRLHRKDDAFSAVQLTSQLGTGAYNQVVGGDMNVAPEEMSIYGRLVNFTDSGF